MNYPLISEYIEAIKSAEDNFEELSYLRPVFGEDGLPIMTSGNFAVVFKMENVHNGRFYAVKCFTKEQEGRAEAYNEIATELKCVSSPYILSIRYLEKELFVDTDQTTETEFPVLLMDWVEGKTLDKYLREILDDKYALEMLAYRFSQLAQWLIPQPFAHGDLKPDNILVREDGTLVLVDYDGMYVPAMKGQKARELGSPDFRHPQRTEDDFDDHIDDFTLISILLSLKAISINPLLLVEYGAADRLILSERDYTNISSSEILKVLYPSLDSELNVLLGLFTIIYERGNLCNMPFRLLSLKSPMTDDEADKLEISVLENKFASYEIVKTWTYQKFAEQFDDISLSNAYYSVSEDVANVYFFRKEGMEDTEVNNFSRLSIGQINKYKQYLRIYLMASGHYVLKLPTDDYLDLSNSEAYDTYNYGCWVDEFGVKYSAGMTFLLEGPVEETIKGSHTWKKGVLYNSYNIQDGTLVICDKAFFDCRGLSSIRCPNSLLAIGTDSFHNCWSLKNINLNYGLLEIGDEAFKDCKSLNSILIPGSLSYIARSAFDGSGINKIYTSFGNGKRLKSMLPNYVDIIEEYPF